jgi:hypothetical protein
VTSAVNTCTTTNCWGIYGTGLPNAPVVELSAAPSMPTGDGRTGELRAATYGRGIWQIPLTTALGTAQPVISLNPAALTFGTQAIATISAHKPSRLQIREVYPSRSVRYHHRPTSAKRTIAPPLPSRRISAAPSR